MNRQIPEHAQALTLRRASAQNRIGAKAGRAFVKTFNELHAKRGVRRDHKTSSSGRYVDAFEAGPYDRPLRKLPSENGSRISGGGCTSSSRNSMRQSMLPSKQCHVISRQVNWSTMPATAFFLFLERNRAYRSQRLRVTLRHQA